MKFENKSVTSKNESTRVLGQVWPQSIQVKSGKVDKKQISL